MTEIRDLFLDDAPQRTITIATDRCEASYQNTFELERKREQDRRYQRYVQTAEFLWLYRDYNQALWWCMELETLLGHTVAIERDIRPMIAPDGQSSVDVLRRLESARHQQALIFNDLAKAANQYLSDLDLVKDTLFTIEVPGLVEVLRMVLWLDSWRDPSHPRTRELQPKIKRRKRGQRYVCAELKTTFGKVPVKEFRDFLRELETPPTEGNDNGESSDDSDVSVTTARPRQKSA